MYRQVWTIKKILFYIIYRIFAKHIPRDLPFLDSFGQSLRRILCRPLFIESAKIVSIGQGVDFDNACFICMKDHSNIGDFAILSGNNAKITIGKHVMMGKHCIILSQNHNYLAESYDGFNGKDVLIGDYAWLGHRVIVLPGVRIGKHSIIGAGSVVTKSVPDYAIAVGNPAVVKKFRNKNKEVSSLHII